MVKTMEEKQILRAANKLAYEGRHVSNPLLAAAAEVFLRDYDPHRKLANSSNGAMRATAYIPPHVPGR